MVLYLNIQIKGTGYYLPEKILTNFDLEKMVDTSDKWITERTGIRERRIGAEGTTTSDLCYEASLMAIKHAGISIDDIDLIIVATATPDMLFPSTACVVQERLGAFKAAAFDLSAGCTGFIYALTVAEKFLLSPAYNHILIIGGEMLSRVMDYTDRNTCVIFGDGAGAVVLGKGEKAPGIIDTFLGADGRGGKHLLMPAGGAAMPATIETVQNHMHYLKMNGPEIYKFATRICVDISRNLLKKAGLSVDDVDIFIPHQANLRIIKSALRNLHIPEEKTLINIQEFGNMSAACIPIALSMAEEEGRLKSGDLILSVAFGAGLTYGGALLYWGRD